MWRHAGFVVGDTCEDFARAKHVIDRIEHIRARAERMFKLAVDELTLALAIGAFEMPPHLGKLQWRRALEREDRLLLVAHREDRALDEIARARAGGEFAYQPRDDLPLLGTGVLRFVDQHVIDAAIEFVMHPRRRCGRK